VTATPITKKKEGTDTFVEPSNPSDETEFIDPIDMPSKKKASALVQG